jgi:hypothetical protein
MLVPARPTMVEIEHCDRGKVKYGSTVHYTLDDLHIDQHCTYYIKDTSSISNQEHGNDTQVYDMTIRLTNLAGHGRQLRKPCRKPPRPPELFLAFLLCALTICTTTLAQLSLSTSSLPLTVTLPPLNTSTQAFDLSITSPLPITSLYLTLSICSLGSNTSIIPAIIVTLDPGNFEIDENSVSDRNSGGVEKANRKARGADVWALAWDKGFANWTYVDEEGVDNVTMRIGFAEGEEASEGNVVLQLGASVDGMPAESSMCEADE